MSFTGNRLLRWIFAIRFLHPRHVLLPKKKNEELSKVMSQILGWIGHKEKFSKSPRDWRFFFVSS
jgi:hypothetical protein